MSDHEFPLQERPPADAELDAWLREQPLLPLPLPLVGRILDRVMPVERQNPWVVAARTAAAVLVFCAAWLAFSGQAPALADIAPEPRVAAALPADLGLIAAPPVLADLPTPDVPPGGDGSATPWLVLGALVLVGGGLLAWRMSRRGKGDPDA